MSEWVYLLGAVGFVVMILAANWVVFRWTSKFDDGKGRDNDPSFRSSNIDLTD